MKTVNGIKYRNTNHNETQHLPGPKYFSSAVTMGMVLREKTFHLWVLKLQTDTVKDPDSVDTVGA